MLQYTHLCFDPLIRWTKDMKFEPRLATKWERIDDLTVKTNDNITGHHTGLIGRSAGHYLRNQRPSRLRVRESVELTGATGRTAEDAWSRWLATGTLEAGGMSGSLLLSGTVAGTNAPANSPETFQVGGTEPLLFDPALLSQRLAMPALPAGSLRGDRITTATAELRSELLGSVFFWAADARGDELGWYRMVGSQMTADAGPIPYLRLPSVVFRAGSAYLLDGPDRGGWRWWLVLGWRP